MKKRYIISNIIWLIIISLYYYFELPVINLQSMEFWSFVIFALIMFITEMSIAYFGGRVIFSKSSRNRLANFPKYILIPGISIIVIITGTLIINLICSPLFNADSYAHRIVIDETGDFTKDIEEVDFNKLPLLDRTSSEKLGDRVMGQMSDYVSQYYVSDQYTQINYNNDIIRVTPLEYAGFIKWFSNRKEGIKAYITVNSVNGEAKLVKLDKGMKYTPSGFFGDNLYRKLRFTYPTTIMGDARFEIDNEGTPYWIIPTYSYTGISIKTKVTGTIIFNPIDGTSKKYKIEDVPSWVDNAYNASLIIEQVDDWGTYNGGFWNSIFGQKNVVNTTTGYNYLAMNDDIYLYTGITSVLSDSSNLGFILSNMRTGKTTYYTVAGAEEYSAMASAKGQVQQMNYESTFPLLINLNNKPTYLVSLKDAAGLVKMYGFIDVEDYQKVTVTDATKGIVVAAQNYLSEYAEEITTGILEEKTITVEKISSASIKGTTYYYIISNGQKYKVSIEVDDNLPFIKEKDTLNIGYYKTEDKIINIEKISY